MEKLIAAAIVTGSAVSFVLSALVIYVSWPFATDLRGPLRQGESRARPEGE